MFRASRRAGAIPGGGEGRMLGVRLCLFMLRTRNKIWNFAGRATTLHQCAFPALVRAAKSWVCTHCCNGARRLATPSSLGHDRPRDRVKHSALWMNGLAEVVLPIFHRAPQEHSYAQRDKPA